MKAGVNFFILLSPCYALYKAFKLTCTIVCGKEIEMEKGQEPAIDYHSTNQIKW